MSGGIYKGPSGQQLHGDGRPVGTPYDNSIKTVKAIIYLHSSKESNYDTGEKLGLTGEALNKFLYAGYELKCEYEVNIETGDAKLISVDGVELKI